MKCKYCGEWVDKNYNFCIKCGAKVEIEEMIIVEKPEEIRPKYLIDNIMLIICLVGFTLSLFPVDLSIIYLGVALAISSLIISIIRAIKKAHKTWAIVMVLSVTTIIVQISWITFFDIIF